MQKVSGVVTNEEIKNNNVRWYWIKEKNGNKMKYVTFNNMKLMFHYNIVVKYRIKKDDNYGDSLIIESVKYKSIITDTERIKKILLQHIGLKKATVVKIMKKYGTETINELISTKKWGVKINEFETKKIIKFQEMDIMGKYQNFFNKFSIKYEDKWMEKLNNVFDGDTEKILENPYDLYKHCGIKFTIVDNIGVQLGYVDSQERTICAIDYIYKKFDKQGLMYASEYEINKILEMENIRNIMDKLKNNLIKIIQNNKIYYTSERMYKMEKYVENYCNNLKNRKIKKNKKYKRAEMMLRTQLDEKQLDAIDMIMNNNLCIITGPPGTGKSYVISTACKYLDEKIIVLAPTGTAVEKLKIDINKNCPEKKIECKTIHSYLMSKETQSNAIIFVDEMSMVSLELFYNFVNFVEKNLNSVRLILSGDKNQLPSIGSGEIFNDMIMYGDISTTILIQIHRTKNKTIIENAKRVLAAENIIPDDDAIIFVESEKNKIEDELKKIMDNKTYGILKNNSCVLIPQRGKGICTNDFNRILQNYYNPDGKKLCSTKLFEIRRDDKMINKKNDYEKGVYNGSILTAREYKYSKITNRKRVPYEQVYINDEFVGETIYTEYEYKNNEKFNHELKCRYHTDETNLRKGKVKKYLKDELNKLELSYAMTVHSAQGKGYETVIIILHSSTYHKLLTRKLLYTALTRAKKRCIIIGDKLAQEKCKKEDTPRVTNLFRTQEVIDDNEYDYEINSEDSSGIDVDKIEFLED